MRKPSTPRPPNYIIPDGRPRTLEREAAINQAFASALMNPAGEAVLEYLRSVTLNSANGPEGLDALKLAHLEGQRYLAGLIIARMNYGTMNLPEIPHE